MCLCVCVSVCLSVCVCVCECTCVVARARARVRVCLPCEQVPCLSCDRVSLRALLCGCARASGRGRKGGSDWAGLLCGGGERGSVVGWEAWRGPYRARATWWVATDPEESLQGDVHVRGDDALVGDRPRGRMWSPPTQRRLVYVVFECVGATFVSATDQGGTCRWAPTDLGAPERGASPFRS